MRKWLPLVAICLGTFMLLVDVTIVNVALPDMAVDLGTTFSSLQWVVDAYALTLAALLLGFGSFADNYGHRSVYLGGLGLFAISSLACGLAPNSEFLIGSRVVQGIGGAAMLATTFALITASYQGRDRGTAFGVWGAVSGASAAVGPILGGLLTQGISWRAIFFVNVPISVIAIAVSISVLSASRPNLGRRLDFPGITTFTVAAAAVTFAMIESSNYGWISTQVIGLLVLGVVALALFVTVEIRSDDPLLDLRLLKNHAFTGVILAALVLNFSAFAVFTYTSIWLQSLLGLSPIEAGLTGLPLSVASFVASAAIGRFLHKAAPGPIIGGGIILIGVGALISAVLVGADSSWPALVAGFFVCGLGVGLATPTLSSTASSIVAPDRVGMAAGAVNTMRQLGYAFGIAVLGSIFTARASSSLSGSKLPEPSGAAKSLAGGQASMEIGAAPAAAKQMLSDAFRAAFASGLVTAFLVAGVIAVVAGAIVLVLMRPSSGASATGAEPEPQTEVEVR